MSEGDSTTTEMKERLYSNKKRLEKLLKTLQKHRLKEDVPKRLIRYYRPYVDSSGEKFYLPKEWKKDTMTGRGKRGKKKHMIDHWQESKINFVLDNEMNGTQLIKNLNWVGRTNDLIEKWKSKKKKTFVVNLKMMMMTMMENNSRSSAINDHYLVVE